MERTIYVILDGAEKETITGGSIILEAAFFHLTA
jgi:hypothetical protein